MLNISNPTSLVDFVYMWYITSMPKQELFPHKQLLALDAELKQAIDDFRYRERFPTEAAAIRELIRRGLGSPTKPKPTKKKP